MEGDIVQMGAYIGAVCSICRHRRDRAAICSCNFDHLRARGFGFVHPSLCVRYFDVRLSEGRTSPSSLIFNNEPE